MLDIQFIRDQKDAVKTAVKNKNLNPEIVDNLLAVDDKRRELIAQVEDIRARRNKLNEELKKQRTDELISQSKVLKKELEECEPALKIVQETYKDLMLQIPNVPLADVPVGKDEKDNVVAKTWGKKREFTFVPQDHVALGESLDIIDFTRGAKVAGFRGYFLKGKGVQLQMALMQYAMDKFIEKGYTPYIPPIINQRQAFQNSGHLPWGEAEAYKLSEDVTDPSNDYFLAGTAEVPLVSYFAGETLKESDLPVKMVGYSPCYRREIGSYGKDTRGFFRVHEFWKIEQVVLCKSDIEESLRLHEQMLGYTEEILQDFSLHYRVLLMCTGDMGESQAKKYDIETWMPGRGDYGETASDSIVTDFQSRRAGIKYQAKDGTLKYVHMLNNTALPSTRIIIAILENFQQEDGSVKLPEKLVKYTGFDTIEASR